MAVGAMAALSALWGCAGSGGDTAAVGLPPEDTSGRLVPDTGHFPFETGADTAPSDETPSHRLTLRQTGTWLLDGPTADPTAMTGTLTVVEVLDGDEALPTCEEGWALVGTRSTEVCDGCAFTFAVAHTLDTSAGACRAPELPSTGDVRTLGYGEAEGRIWWDYGDTGVWVPLYDAVPGELPGEIAFSWEETLGVAVDDDG